MSIMDIVAIGNENKNWVKTEDGRWHHICITDDGATYINGKLVLYEPVESVKPVEEVHDPVKRWEILDFSK